MKEIIFQIQVIFRLLQRITMARIWNLFLLGFSFWFTRISRHYFHRGQPMAISLEPTNRCQLHCPYCPSGAGNLDRPPGKMDVNLFRGIIDDIGDKLIHLACYFQGEPLLHPGLPGMIQYARSKGIFTVVSTNGNLIDRDWAERLVLCGLDHLIISVDGMTEKVYQAYRVGGRLENVLKGIALIVEAKKELKKRHPLLEAQFVVTRQNEHQKEAFIYWSKSSGVNHYTLKSAQLDLDRESIQWIPEDRRYARYRVDDTGNIQIKNPLKNHCTRVWTTPVVTWDGKVLPCCFDKTGRYPYGDATIDRIPEIWKSVPADRFRKRVFTKRKEIDICTNCSEGLRH
ncbi:MAG: radical SAM protein [Bacteroidales bacterium]|nr:radical SAM protein [Bacteroidales bacterium]